MKLVGNILIALLAIYGYYCAMDKLFTYLYKKISKPKKVNIFDEIDAIDIRDYFTETEGGLNER